MSSSFLWSDFPVGSVNFVSGFRVGCALASEITLEDDGAMEDVFSKWKMEMITRIGFKA